MDKNINSMIVAEYLGLHMGVAVITLVIGYKET